MAKKKRRMDKNQLLDIGGILTFTVVEDRGRIFLSLKIERCVDKRKELAVG